MGENCIAKSLRKFQFLHLLTRKKVVREKNVKNKSCRQFYVIGGEFFLFWQNRKNVGLTAKNVLLSIGQSHFLTKIFANFLCTWKLFFPPYLLISTCLYATFFFDHPNVYSIKNISYFYNERLQIRILRDGKTLAYSV